MQVTLSITLPVQGTLKYCIHFSLHDCSLQNTECRLIIVATACSSGLKFLFSQWERRKLHTVTQIFL
jgi:hypothetical protein